MPALVAGIHALLSIISNKKDVDGRDEPGHDKRDDYVWISFARA